VSDPQHPSGAGTRPLLLTGIAIASLLTGATIAIAGIVNIVHLGDTAGGVFGVFLGSLFLLGARYVWRLHGRPTIESTVEGIIFHADVDPVMRMLTGSRTVTFRWEDIEIIEFRPTASGWTIFLDLDGGPVQGERMIPIAFPSDQAVAALIADMRNRSAGKRPPDKPTRWLDPGDPFS